MNTLDMNKILLTPNVVNEYLQFAEDMAKELAAKGVKKNEIPDEQIVELKGGGLEIFVMLDDKEKTKISFSVRPDEWAWAN